MQETTYLILKTPARENSMDHMCFKILLPQTNSSNPVHAARSQVLGARRNKRQPT